MFSFNTNTQVIIRHMQVFVEKGVVSFNYDNLYTLRIKDDYTYRYIISLFHCDTFSQSQDDIHR